MEGLTQNEKIIWSCWEEKSPREVVREAAAKGTHIKLAYKYLEHKNGWSESTAKDWFYAEVSAWIVQLLMRKQIFKVLHILNKVEINPEEHLIALARESVEIAFRDFIVEHLKKTQNEFKAENVEKWQHFFNHWNLLRYLEKSFESDGTLKQNKVFGIGADRVIVNETEMKALTVEKIEKYPMQWRSKIAACLFFEFFEFSLLEFLTVHELWNHLLKNNKAMILVRWINIQTSEVVRDMNARYNFFNNANFVQKFLNVDTKGLDVQILVKLDELFRKWPIDKDMIDSIKTMKCFSYTKMCVYDTLCSYGIVNDDEKTNLYMIISRLARTENLKLIDDVFTESCSTLTKTEFYIELAKYCVKHKLYKMIAFCVEGDLLNTDLTHLEEDAKNCIELWLLFKSIEQTSDRQSHVIPIYKTCQQIADGDIDDYISENPYLVLGMILLDDNAKLFDIFKQNEYLEFRDFRLANKCRKDKLPHLQNVYQKFTDVTKFTRHRDVNVYQLLSGYHGLDVSKIFEFQMVSHTQSDQLFEKSDRQSLGSLLFPNVDVSNVQALSRKSSEIPNFANEKLMKRYGYIAKLNYMYYLKQYRPCNASQAFVMQQYQMYNRLQEKGIKSACCEAHMMGLQHWNDPALTACAVSFIAIIGGNPARSRVHISAAQLMKEHMITSKAMPEEAAIKCVNEYMTSLTQGKDDTANEILKYLEEIAMYNIKRKRDSKADMSTILYETQVAVKFSMLHNQPLPEMQLRQFVEEGSWFDFLLFGDVFRYPLAQMLELSQQFENVSYAEHLRHIILHRNVEDITSSDKEHKISSNGQRRVTRLNSAELSPTGSCGFDFPEASFYARDLWEVTALCHGPEDPPAALVRAAGLYDEPLFALIATCYEPNAAGLLWAYWTVSALGSAAPPEARDLLRWDIGEQHAPDGQLQRVAELCLDVGHVRTLHESLLIFFPESPLTMLTAFLCRCAWQRSFDSDTSKLLHSFSQHCQRRCSVDNAIPWALQRQSLHKLSVSLVNIALAKCFDSALHQREFLRCLVGAQFGKDFSVTTPDYSMIHEILKISMETSSIVNIAKILHNDAREYLIECVDLYTVNKKYDVALKIAKLARLPVNNILIAEWTNKHDELLLREDVVVEDKDWTLFIAQCSDALKEASVSFGDAVDFLISHIPEIQDQVQKFYSYRIVMSWFEENHEYGTAREGIEHLMWDAYFRSERKNIFLAGHRSLMHFILSGQRDYNVAQKMGQAIADKPFCMQSSEIDIESDTVNIQNVVVLEDDVSVERWRSVLNDLIELKLMSEAYRLAALFKGPDGHKRAPPCPVQIVRTCLKLAEGVCSPYDLPQELRLVISSSLTQRKFSASETTDPSYEELVVITEKQEPAPENSTHLAVREDADRLSSLEALAARSGLALAKQVASYYRISLQIGWNYTTVLKHQNNPMEFINYVSGRARMSLANLVFRTFNIPSKQIAEYLCHEMVAAIISPHLVKTSSFRQKEHFQYTLWGYPLNSDIEMFLNMRPDACSHIGRLMLDHLMAFRKIYKCNMSTKYPTDTQDDASLDLDTLIDEEYQTVEDDEVEVLTSRSGTTEPGTLNSAETESVFSISTVYSYSNKISRDSRRNLFDVISKSNVHIRYEVKSNVRKVTKGAKLSTKQVNIISIELLVLAHECFSCACDTEGVAVVLRSAQALTGQLLAARSWRLMVRLLTGLARYTEMAYVFQALRDHHQFEFLLGQFDYMLGQQPDKITEFKQGLLDFLKHHCPGDTEAYVMVALHFNMYSEAANVKKKQAMDLIETLEKIAIDSARASAKKPFQIPQWLMIHDNGTTRSMLETALNHCTDAAELYLQGGCMGFAGEMAGLAQQIALQLCLLNASPTRLILNRSNEQLYSLVSEYLSFMEGLVLMVGRGGAQWRELAYRRALSNDQEYLRDMAAHRPDVASDFLLRYKSETKTSSVSQAAMAELRNLCR